MHEMPQMMHEMPHVPLRVDSAFRVEFPQGHEVRPHQHSTWELVYFLEGHARCPTGNDVYEAQPGTALLTPPRTVHHEIASTAWACYAIAIEAPPQHPWPRAYTDDASRTLGGLCTILVREWAGQERDRDEMLGLLLNQFDILLRRRYAQNLLSAAERMVREVEHRLAEGFSKSITIKDIAADLGVSHSYLRAQFARLRGRTPMAHRQALRVQHAIALIRTSDTSLEVIAQLCGYDSASHLSRNIKRATGKSPGSFRTK